MAELSVLMNSPPDPETFKNMSAEEQAMLKSGVEEEMQGGHADGNALPRGAAGRRQALKEESKRKKAEEQAGSKRERRVRDRLANTKAATDSDVGRRNRHRAAQDGQGERRAQEG